MTTTPGLTDLDFDHRNAVVINRVHDELLNGTYFRNHERSYRSIRRYSVARREGWGYCIETLGRMAQTSDALAQIAAAIIREVPLYQTDHEAAAKVYEVAARVLAEPYEDVVGMAAPDAGRRRDHIKDWTLGQRIALAGWLTVACSKFHLGSVPGHGWALTALAEAKRVHLPALPAVR